MDDIDAGAFQPIDRPAYVVDFLHHEIDVMQGSAIARGNGARMVARVEKRPQEPQILADLIRQAEACMVDDMFGQRAD